MTHAEQRICERLRDEAKLNMFQVKDILDKAQMIASSHDVSSVGALVHRVKFQGTAWTNKSNGDQVWIIIRGGRLVTVMFRRSTQPDTCEALRVDRVVKFN
jgi:hypothetical protein